MSCGGRRIEQDTGSHLQHFFMDTCKEHRKCMVDGIVQILKFDGCRELLKG